MPQVYDLPSCARLRLRVHENADQAQPCAAGIPWLGFVVYPDRRRVKARKVVQARRRLEARYRAWCAGEISFAESTPACRAGSPM